MSAELGNWCVNWKLVWWLLAFCDEVMYGVPPVVWWCWLWVTYIWLDGAADWTVVRVVVRERTDGAGEEKVLPSPPPRVLTPPPTVTNVPAFEYAASDIVVSPFVESVGAADFALAAGSCWSIAHSEKDGSDRDLRLRRSLGAGSENDR